MQDKKDPDVRKILLEVSNHFKRKNLKDFAAYIGVSKNTVYGWIGRKSVGDPALILEKDASRDHITYHAALVASCFRRPCCHGRGTSPGDTDHPRA